MEVSNEIKEDIRKTQTDLKHAIRVHQVWVKQLQEDENNVHLKSKVKEAENEIVAIGQTQKLVLDRLRRELELYQQRLKARNKQINIENDNRYIAQQLKDHQLQYRRNRNISLLKPSVLSEIHIKTEEVKDNPSDSESESKLNDKENSNHCEDVERYRNYSQLHAPIHDSRNNFANTLNKVKEAFINSKPACSDGSEQSEWSEVSASPSPPPLPAPGAPITQEMFMRVIGLITPAQKEVIEKRRIERRKRAAASTSKNDFLFGNYDMMPKRKKIQFPYLQTPNEPPQTRSAKLRKQQNQNKSSREGSPSGSSGENKVCSASKKPAWAAALPAGLTLHRIYPSQKKVCQVCGRNDVRSLLAWCACGRWQHTVCGSDARCAACHLPLPDPPPTHSHTHLYTDKLAERKSLQEKNIKLCVELRKLESRAASLKAHLESHHAEKRQLLADQLDTQRQLRRLLDFIHMFKDTHSPPLDRHDRHDN